MYSIHKYVELYIYKNVHGIRDIHGMGYDTNGRYMVCVGFPTHLVGSWSPHSHQKTYGTSLNPCRKPPLISWIFMVKKTQDFTISLSQELCTRILRRFAVTVLVE
jgi:hypothetical protein